MNEASPVYTHISVLGEEAPEMLVYNPDGLYVDGTFGRGGHTRRILSKLSPQGRVIAFDRDPEAIEAAKAITDPRFSIMHRAFSQISPTLHELGIDGVDGIFLDIGVSSPQIDDPERGFSFRFDGPLDMRMDTTRGLTAAQWLAQSKESEIKAALRDYGEERFAGLIARKIVETREVRPIKTTKALAQLVASVVPANKKDPGQHPATRTFQGIRIAVNAELDELRSALYGAVRCLKPQGRLAVITFHSLEDRLVKRFFEQMAHPEHAIDPRLPLTQAQLPSPYFEAIERIKPSQAECDANPRARSAILRVGTRTATPYEAEE